MGRVVCLGEALIDQVVDSTGRRHDYPGGAPANVAVALSSLGIPTEFVGCLGQDAQGQTLVDILCRKGVGCRGVQRCQQPTRTVEVLCSSGGDRAFGGFLGGATTGFADAHLATSALCETLFGETACLVTGTLGLAYIETGSAMKQAASWVKANGGQLVVDVNWRPTFWPDPQNALSVIEPWLAMADWLKFSVDEAVELFGIHQVTELASRFPASQGILLTDGERGCCYQIAGHTGDLSAFSVACQDTTGAGDAFMAGIIYQLYHNEWRTPEPKAVSKMVTFASGMGALTTLKPGAIAAQPTPEQLLTFLRERTGETWQLQGR